MNTKSAIIGLVMGVALSGAATFLYNHQMSTAKPDEAGDGHVKSESVKATSQEQPNSMTEQIATPASGTAVSSTLPEPRKSDSQKPVECSVIADEKKAERLITRLFKDVKIYGYDRVILSPGASVCLLEVDLSILGNTGFMYVLPNGEELLNGPMLDKRSRVGVPTAEQVENFENGQVDMSTSAAISTPRTAQDPQASPPPVDTKSQATLQQANSSPVDTKFNTPTEVFQAMKALPALVSESKGRAVYVLLDPLCTHCQSLFKKSGELAEKYGIQWHWVPMFTNTSGHAMTALVMKVAEKNPVEGLSLLSEMMTDNFDVQKYADQFRSLQKADYERPQPNALTFLKILKSSSKAAGTPYVAFEIPATGQVEVISGEPEESDLLPLLGGADPQG